MSAFVDPKYFDVLPLHPAPRSFESLMSYLTRIAEANAMSHPLALARILGVPTEELTRLPDYSPLSIGNIAVRTMCSKERLMACTLFHLERKFGRRRSDPANTLSGFLRSSLSPFLRYCPLCLADDLSYSLKWRFLPVSGCSIHGCRLLDRCAHCESALPLFVFPPKMGACCSCGGELRSYPVHELDEEELRTVHGRTGDIEFLLSPHPCEEDDEMLRRVGYRFADVRRKRHLSIQHIADAISVPLYEVMKIERGDAGRYVSFDGYLRYADYLGKTLKEVFLESAVQERDAASALDAILNTGPGGGRQSLDEEYESVVLEQVQEIIRSIIDCGERAGMVTIVRRMRCMHMPSQLLQQYPSANAVVEQLVIDAQNERVRRKQQRENDLVAKVEGVIAAAHRSQRVITQREIGDSLGLSRTQLRYYPRVRAIVQQYPSCQLRTRTRPHEEDLVEQVHAAVAHLRSSGKFVCQEAISRLVGLPVYTLKKYPLVDSILGPVRQEYHLQRKKCPER